MSSKERRIFPRIDSEIACKVRRDARTVFSPGRTVNVSPGGAALMLLGPREARVGERIAVAFEHARCAVTRSVHMVTGTIVRAGPCVDNAQEIALAFDTPQFGLEGLELPMAA
jgi:hypothetical protein